MQLGPFNVRYTHLRDKLRTVDKLDSHTGTTYTGTVCQVYLDGLLVSNGESKLSPGDNFSRSVGRYLTTKRAADAIRDRDPNGAKDLMQAFFSTEAMKKNGKGIQHLRAQLKVRGLQPEIA